MWWGLVPFLLLALVFAVICKAAPEKFQSVCVIKASKDEVRVILEGGGDKATASGDILQVRMLEYEAVMAALANTDLLAEIEREARDDPGLLASRKNQLYDRVRKNTRIQEFSKVLMQVSYLGNTPGEAVTVLSSLVNHFVENALKREQVAARRAREIGLKAYSGAKNRLEQIETRLVAFTHDHPTVGSAAGGKQQEVDQARSVLDQLDRQIAATRRRVDHFAEQLDGMAKYIVDEVKQQQNAQVEMLVRRLANLKMQLAVSLRTFTELHPSVKALREEIEATTQELAGAREQVSEDVVLKPNLLREQMEQQKFMDEARLEGLLATRRSSQLRLTRLGEEFRALPNLQKEFAGLQRDRATASAVYVDTLRDFRNADEKFNTTLEGLVSFSVLNPAREPHSSDNRHIIKLAMMGLFVSVAAAVGGIAGAEFLDQSFTDVETARDILRLPSLGVIPYIETTRGRRERRLKILLIVSLVAVGLIAIGLAMWLTGAGGWVWNEIKLLCKNLA